MTIVHTGVSTVRRVDDLHGVLKASATRPVLLFKHSAACGLSAQAYDELKSVLGMPHLPADVYLVEVWTERAISDSIAAKLRVRHESPQILLLKDGRVMWSASHCGVTAQAIRGALDASSQGHLQHRR